MKESKKQTNPLAALSNAYATVEQLKGEQTTRANSDDLINTNVKTVAQDCKNYKEILDGLLHDKQDKVDLELDTNSKTIIGAINEVNLKIETKTEQEVTKNYLDDEIVKLATNLDNQIIKIEANIDDLEKEIKNSIIILKENSYKKIKEVEVNDTQYIFDEYDENYWHLFVFEFNHMLKREISGTLERPSGLSSKVNSQNVLLDYSPTSSMNMIFWPETKTLVAQKWDQKIQTINKIHIYRKL